MKPLIEGVENQKKLSEKLIQDIEIMLRIRWSTTDWTDRFAQFRADNEKRQG